MSEKVIAAVQAIETMVNTYSLPTEEFNDLASRMHRTNQQSFTRLCLAWIEYVGSDAYRYDARNIGSRNVCKEMLQLFLGKQLDNGFTGESLEIMAKPSGYCNMV